MIMTDKIIIMRIMIIIIIMIMIMIMMSGWQLLLCDPARYGGELSPPLH